jgi:hypothetical protein
MSLHEGTLADPDHKWKWFDIVVEGQEYCQIVELRNPSLAVIEAAQL